jgi:signal peptidase I
MQPAAGVELTVPPAFWPPSATRRRWPRRLARLVALLIAPGVATLLTMRFIVPSRLEGAQGGLTRWLAWLGDQQPLLLGVGLFVALSEGTRYWLAKLRPEVAGATGSVPAASAPGGTASRRRFIWGLAVIAVVAFFVRGSVVATFRIVGPSMLPTFEIGDRVLVNKLAYGLAPPFSGRRVRARLPKRGDLVVFQANGLTGAGGPSSVVKRVIGLPGDDIAYVNDSLQINGWRVPTCDAGPYVDLTGRLTVRGRLTVEYLADQTYLTVRKPMEPNAPPYRVRPGEVYVVGDDRGQSSDSRSWNEGNGGGVPTEVLQGRVSRVLFGARPDGRLDFSRIWAPPLDVRVRMPSLDMTKTNDRIATCLSRRPAVTTPPEP